MKSHFEFTRKQRDGIFLLLLFIVVLQCVYFFVEIPPKDILIDKAQLETFQKEVDSLRLVELEKQKPKRYPFNPNFLTDYKGYTLGMSTEEIDRLLTFRAKDQWVYSARQFQEVTKISDSLLETIAPYFKFPEWVEKKRSFSSFKTNSPKPFNRKRDLNKATASELQSVNGIGKVLSERIIRFRNNFFRWVYC